MGEELPRAKARQRLRCPTSLLPGRRSDGLPEELKRALAAGWERVQFASKMCIRENYCLKDDHNSAKSIRYIGVICTEYEHALYDSFYLYLLLEFGLGSK
jgi:hypothetical protein